MNFCHEQYDLMLLRWAKHLMGCPSSSFASHSGRLSLKMFRSNPDACRQGGRQLQQQFCYPATSGSSHDVDVSPAGAMGLPACR